MNMIHKYILICTVYYFCEYFRFDLAPKKLKGDSGLCFWPPCIITTLVTILKITQGGWVTVPPDHFLCNASTIWQDNRVHDKGICEKTIHPEKIKVDKAQKWKNIQEYFYSSPYVMAEWSKTHIVHFSFVQQICQSGERRMSEPLYTVILNFKHTLSNDLVFHNPGKHCLSFPNI